MAKDVQHISHSFDPDTVEESCLRLVQELSPRWKKVSRQQVKFTPFTEGITNTIIKVSLQDPTESTAGADRSAVLVRAYGNGTDTMIDRAKELRVHSSLAERQLASPVLATFDNGFICGFVPGRTSEAKDYQDKETSRPIARRLAQWHSTLPLSMLVADVDEIPSIWTNAIKWIDLLPNDTAELRHRNESFRTELKWLLELLGNAPGVNGKDMVVSHTDLLCGNIIIQQKPSEDADQEVTIIDYEYCVAAPPAFDIANWFGEWMGPELEHSWMPSQSQRYDFIDHYVRSFLKDANSGIQNPDDQSLDSTVKQLYEQTDLFRGLPGFYWGIWGLIQASISNIDFDYDSYAAKRHSEYWGWKAEYDGSRKREAKEMTVREQAWAK